MTLRKPHEVPTHLNVEDKVAFGLTVRQFLFLLVGSSGVYSAWQQLNGVPWPLRIGIAVVCTVITLAFALWRPADRPLEEWAAAALLFLALPRRTVWQPVEPDPADWRPATGGWHELVPNLSWAEGEDVFG